MPQSARILILPQTQLHERFKKLTRPRFRTGCDACVSFSNHSVSVKILEMLKLKNKNKTKKQLPQMNSLRMFSFCLLNWEFASPGTLK